MAVLRGRPTKDQSNPLVALRMDLADAEWLSPKAKGRADHMLRQEERATAGFGLPALALRAVYWNAVFACLYGSLTPSQNVRNLCNLTRVARSVGVGVLAGRLPGQRAKRPIPRSPITREGVNALAPEDAADDDDEDQADAG